ncbi:MAG: hypothetical protein OWS03_04340 [Alicyclobacillaceae bacterium]|nr:hypothetical protein [Alicyclobacillaceae bacterium]
MKQCRHCRSFYPESAEYYSRRKDGTYLAVCKGCDRIRKRESSARARAKKRAERLGQPVLDRPAKNERRQNLAEQYSYTTTMDRRVSTDAGQFRREDIALLTLRVLQKLREEEEMKAAYERRKAWEASRKVASSKTKM